MPHSNVSSTSKRCRALRFSAIGRSAGPLPRDAHLCSCLATLGHTVSQSSAPLCHMPVEKGSGSRSAASSAESGWLTSSIFRPARAPARVDPAVPTRPVPVTGQAVAWRNPSTIRTGTHTDGADASFAVQFHLLGSVDYATCQWLQRRLVYEVGGYADGRIVVLLCEHPPLISGRAARIARAYSLDQRAAAQAAAGRALGQSRRRVCPARTGPVGHLPDRAAGLARLDGGRSICGGCSRPVTGRWTSSDIRCGDLCAVVRRVGAQRPVGRLRGRRAGLDHLSRGVPERQPGHDALSLRGCRGSAGHVARPEIHDGQPVCRTAAGGVDGLGAGHFDPEPGCLVRHGALSFSHWTSAY